MRLKRVFIFCGVCGQSWLFASFGGPRDGAGDVEGAESALTTAARVVADMRTGRSVLEGVCSECALMIARKEELEGDVSRET